MMPRRVMTLNKTRKKTSRESQSAALRTFHRLLSCQVVFTKICHYCCTVTIATLTTLTITTVTTVNITTEISATITNGSTVPNTTVTITTFTITSVTFLLFL